MPPEGKSQNYYEDVLGLLRTASDEEIRKTYFQVVRTVHPDKSRRASVPERFHEVQAAWRVLSDPTRRLMYDLRTFGDSFAAGSTSTADMGEILMSRQKDQAALDLRNMEVELQRIVQKEQKKRGVLVKQRKMYDVAVVGAGLIGSATAKYLAKKGLKVALVGPSEAQGALGACYDEGIYRIADPDKVWADLADASIKEYEAIESESGQSFHHETGFLALGDPNMAYIHQVQKTMAAFGTEGSDFFVYTKKEDFEEHFPFLRLSWEEHGWRAIWQPRKAGHLSPRSLAKIQAALAIRNGADVFSTQLDGVQAEADHWALQLGKEIIKAHKVLLATGWSTSWLTPQTRTLQIQTFMSQAVLLEVSEESAEALQQMPVMILRGPRDPEEFWYILPPIKYPSGRTYLKMGYDGQALNQALATEQEAHRWMAQGQARPELFAVAEKMARTYFPGVTFTGSSSIVCITDDTQPNVQGQRRPYIDFLQKGLGVASGGNGWAAKSSDHIGYLAAEMMSNPSGWATDAESQSLFPKELFQACYKPRL